MNIVYILENLLNHHQISKLLGVTYYKCVQKFAKSKDWKIQLYTFDKHITPEKMSVELRLSLSSCRKFLYKINKTSHLKEIKSPQMIFCTACGQKKYRKYSHKQGVQYFFIDDVGVFWKNRNVCGHHKSIKKKRKYIKSGKKCRTCAVKLCFIKGRRCSLCVVKKQSMPTQPQILKFCKICRVCQKSIPQKSHYCGKDCLKVNKKPRNRKHIKTYRVNRKRRLRQNKPKWQSWGQIENFITTRPEGFHLDHIIPLNHPLVCGLNCIQNFQWLSPKENNIKSNKFDGTTDNISWKI